MEQESLHRVTRGSIEAETDLEPCWVVGSSFPCWLGALPGMCMLCERLFLTDTCELESARAFLDEGRSTVHHDVGQKEWASVDDNLSTWCLVEGRPSRGMLGLCEAKGIPRILLSTAPICDVKRSVKGGGTWRTVHIQVELAWVGGITAASTRVFFSWNTDKVCPSPALPSSADIPQAVSRDASTVLGHTARHKSSCRAPEHRLVMPPSL